MIRLFYKMLTLLIYFDDKVQTLKLLIMKSKITLLTLILIFVAFSGYTQISFEPASSGEYIFNANNTPCLTAEERAAVKQDLQFKVEELRRQNRLAFAQNRRGNHPLFIWPVQKASDVTYNEIWGVSNYVDHNPATPNQLTDYNCDTRTYDTTSGYNHQGLDIFTWPFGWKMMDDDDVEIIAAAAGQIIAKHDGEFDRSCDFSTSTPWNAVFVQHSDGSVAWYGHMKNGSTTSKGIGDMVAQGEYLGIVGSSGTSTGPHLHFEVYTDNTYTQLVDPYDGPCNGLNADSWWQSQKPHVNPGINAVITQTDAPVFPSCPNVETSNASNQFETSDTIYFGLYLRDQVNGSSANLKIIRPDDSILYDFNFDMTVSYYASWAYWYYQGVFDMEGDWTWQATYGGETVSHTFNVDDPLSVDEDDFSTTSIYPNPFNDIINISSTKKIVKAKVIDILGKTIFSIEEFSEGISTINLSTISNGMYILKLESDSNETKTIQLIKK